MTTDTANPETPSAAPAPEPGRQGPGRIIRQARERARLSPEELAAQTKLARATIDAIERDDFTTLNEPVYVRGYYRKCAKALALPEAELISAYERLATPKAPPHPTKLLIGSGGRNSLGRTASPFSRRWILIVLIAAAIGAGLWFLRSSTSSTAPAPVSPPPAAVPAPTAPAPRSGEAASEAPGGNVPPPAEATANLSMAPALANPPAPASAPAPAASAPKPAAETATGAALILRFTSTSWVRVEDANGRSLLSGVIQAGDSHTLEGTPPYSVFLGNARGVKLEYQGKPVDTQPYVKDNATAKFSVP